MRVKDIMSDKVISISVDASVSAAMTLLVNSAVSAMPALDADGVMVGIVTEADLLPYAALRTGQEAACRPVEGRTVAQIMTAPVIMVDEDAPLAKLALLMIERRIKSLPVRRGDAIVGMIGRAELLRGALAGSASASVADEPISSIDDALRGRVLAAVKGQRWARAKNFDAVSVDGVMHLWGVAPDDDTVSTYEEAVQAVAGVKSVVLHMQVAHPERLAFAYC